MSSFANKTRLAILISVNIVFQIGKHYLLCTAFIRFLICFKLLISRLFIPFFEVKSNFQITQVLKIHVVPKEATYSFQHNYLWPITIGHFCESRTGGHCSLLLIWQMRVHMKKERKFNWGVSFLKIFGRLWFEISKIIWLVYMSIICCRYEMKMIMKRLRLWMFT